MSTLCRTAAATMLVVALASPALAGQVTLQIRDGLVTLDAKDATLPEILAEWARVGHTRIINADRAPTAPMTLHFDGVAEQVVLDTLLRSAAGFIAATRIVADPQGSIYDRIMLMPGVRPALSPAAATASRPLPPLTFRDRLQAQPANTTDDDPDPILPTPLVTGVAGPGAAQPGMPTVPAGVMPYGQPAPSSGNQGSPYNSPYGTPYGNPYGNPYSPSLPAGSGQVGGTPGTVVGPPVVNRPGMPTPPQAPPKGPGGPGGPGGQ